MVEKKNEIITDRLILKPASLSNFNALYSMYINSNVMQFIYDGSTLSREDALKRVTGFEMHWKAHGFGMWTLQCLPGDGQVMGYAGLRYFEAGSFKGEVELGYLIDEPYWGRGYAAEAVSACISFGLKIEHIHRILATILPENVASQKVAEKAGLSYSLSAEVNGLTHLIYEIEREKSVEK